MLKLLRKLTLLKKGFFNIKLFDVIILGFYLLQLNFKIIQDQKK